MHGVPLPAASSKQNHKKNAKKNYVARPMRLTPKDFDDFGMTSGCAKCDELRGFVPRRLFGRHARHSQQCRDRIAGELARTADGQARLALQSWRMDVVDRERNKF